MYQRIGERENEAAVEREARLAEPAYERLHARRIDQAAQAEKTDHQADRREAQPEALAGTPETADARARAAADRAGHLAERQLGFDLVRRARPAAFDWI